MTSLHYNDTTASFFVQVAFPAHLHTKYGAPSAASILLTVHPAISDSPPSVSWLTTYFNKTSTRLPEQLSLDFLPQPLTAAPADGVLHINKLGRGGWIEGSAEKTVVNGTSHLAGQWEGVTLGRRILITSEDVPLVSYGRQHSSPFMNPMPQRDLLNTSLISYSIFNNIWGTNYPQWSELTPEDRHFTSRYSLRILNPASIEQ